MNNYLNDKRSIEYLREGLGTSEHLVVESAVHGLATLDDTESIPRIAQTCARFPPLLAERIAMAAKGFRDPGVHVLFERFIKDPEKLKATEKVWREEHAK